MDVSIWAALIAGVLSFLAPCILPLVPVYIGYIAGDNSTLQRTMPRTLLFVAGFSFVFISFGALAGRFGFYALRELSWLTLFAGIVVIFAGVLLVLKAVQNKLGYFSIPILKSLQGFGSNAAEKANKLNDRKYAFWLAPLLMGAALAIAWTPCIGPVLGGVLTLAYARETVAQGSFLLFVYSIGLGIPFVMSALFARRIAGIRKLQKWNRAIQAASGVFLVVFGLIIATDNLTFINSYLYRHWPF